MVKTIVIIGGGITGLTAACHLQQHIRSGELEARVILIEAEPRLGGKIHTVHQSGFAMETGADSIVSRKMSGLPYMEQFGLSDEVVSNATGRSLLYVDGKLVAIPEDTLFGIPLGVESLVKSKLVSAEGKVEALKDLYTPNELFTSHDSVGRFLRYFLGDELVDRQIAPVLSGVYSGSLDELTIASTLPYLLEYKNEYGSILKGLEANRHKFMSKGEGKFMSFASGLSGMIDRMENSLTDVEVRKGVKALELALHGDKHLIRLSDGEVLEADVTVLGILHTHAKEILQDPVLDRMFGQFAANSLISVYLGFDVPDDRLPGDATGFIVAEGGELRCGACTWTSRKWPHTSPDRRLLLRLFYKSSSPEYPVLARMSDAELIQVARRDLEVALGLDEPPVTSVVTRWEHTMPVYHVGHKAHVDQLEEELERRYPGVILAGCSYHGVGIADCMQSGERAARRCVEWLGVGN